MQISLARSIATAWLAERAGTIPNLVGAFVHGSGAVLPDQAELAPTSDFDLMLVVDDPVPANKLGKFRFRGLLLEVSWLPHSEIATAEQVLGNYYLAGSFRQNSILLDRSGALGDIQQQVAAAFTDEIHVRRRLQHAAERVRSGFPWRNDAPLPDQITSWLFSNGVLTHLLLVAGLQNPTVRTRYLAARQLLERTGQMELYPLLLASLGADRFDDTGIAKVLQDVAEQFDAASAVVPPDYPFTADLRADGRVVAIDGSANLISQGNAREALFWIVATATRCQQVFWRHGDPELLERFCPPYTAMLAQLGVGAPDDRQQRTALVQTLLPTVQHVAEIILTENPDITRRSSSGQR